MLLCLYLCPRRWPMFYFREILSMTYLTYQFNHPNQLTDLIIGLFAIVTVLKLNGPEPSSFEPF